MQLDQALDQGQAEPSFRSPLAAREFLENSGLIRRRDADPGIGDGQQQLTSRRIGLDADRTAGRGEFDRIGNQVEERLLEAALVGLDRRRSAAGSAS